MQSLNFREALDAAHYTDDSPATFSEMFPRVMITNWDDIKLADRTAIHTAALSNQYSIDPNV